MRLTRPVRRMVVILSVILTGCFGLVAIGQDKAAEKTKQPCTGTVVDSSGKPIDGVRVFNVGDAPDPIVTHTDATGQFRLEGFNSGVIYLFAQKAGYRFSGVRATAGAAGVAIKLLRDDEPMPSRPVASESMPPEQQQALARTMLEKLWKDNSHNNRWPLIRAMIPLDPKCALDWAAKSNTDCAGYIHAAMSEKIADDDLDETLSLLEPGQPERLNTLRKLARRYIDSDPAKAMRCTEELLVGARALDQPWRTGYLAEAASLLIRLGKKDVGEKLLDEAGEMAANLDSESHAYIRGIVARAMAPTDLKRALNLLEPITAEQNSDYFRKKVAVAICLDNLDQALEIAKTTTEYVPPPNHFRLRIAYRLAPTRPADAIRVAEMDGIDPGYSDSLNGVKATALGWVAVAVAPRDRDLAWSLIDRAFTVLMEPDKPGATWSGDGGLAAQAAFLAVQAKRVGYPDMESVIHRALACRPTPKTVPSPVHRVDSKVFMAAFLGLVDPSIAKDILDSIDPRDEAIQSGTIRGIWVKAWILADAKRGQTLFEEEIASIAHKPNTEREFYELVEAAVLVAAPVDEKAEHISAGFHSPADDQ